MQFGTTLRPSLYVRLAVACCGVIVFEILAKLTKRGRTPAVFVCALVCPSTLLLIAAQVGARTLPSLLAAAPFAIVAILASIQIRRYPSVVNRSTGTVGSTAILHPPVIPEPNSGRALLYAALLWAARLFFFAVLTVSLAPVTATVIGDNGPPLSVVDPVGGALQVALTALGFWIVAGPLLGRKRRLAAIGDFRKLRERDLRPRILFLRAFSDDRLTAEAGSRWRRLLARLVTLNLFSLFSSGPDLGSPIEDILGDALWPVGPLVGIGGAREGIRDYPESPDWLQHVLRASDESRAILVLVRWTPNVEKELTQILRRSHASKLAFVLPPKELDAINRWVDLKEALAGDIVMPELSEEGIRRGLIIVPSENGQWKLILGSGRDAANYALAGAVLSELLATRTPVGNAA